MPALFSSRQPDALPPSAARSVGPGRLARLGRRTAAGLAVTVTLAAALPSPAHPASRSGPGGPAGATFTGAEFDGVSSVSAADAWAVGSITAAQGREYRTLVAHWDGTRWARVPSPSPGEPDVATLAGSRWRCAGLASAGLFPDARITLGPAIIQLADTPPSPRE